MSIFSLLGIAVALAMDAFAVAIATGINLRNVSFRQFFRLSFHFGLFQALMPIIGWYFGYTIKTYIEAYSHWIAFLLLFLVGANMFREALQKDEESDAPPRKDQTRGMTLVILSVATSIDALAVGVSMSLLQISIFLPALIIGIVAGAFTIIGLHLGKRVAHVESLTPIAEIIGGVVLWVIGLNILRESGVFSSLL